MAVLSGKAAFFHPLVHEMSEITSSKIRFRNHNSLAILLSTAGSLSPEDSADPSTKILIVAVQASPE
jgi:hypothetical protein